MGDSYYYTARGNADGIDAELDPTPQVRIALRNILDRWGSDDGTLNLPSLMSKLNLDKIKDVNEARELIKLCRLLLLRVFNESVLLLWDKRFWTSLTSHGIMKSHPHPKRILTWCDALLVRVFWCCYLVRNHSLMYTKYVDTCGRHRNRTRAQTSSSSATTTTSSIE